MASQGPSKGAALSTNSPQSIAPGAPIAGDANFEPTIPPAPPAPKPITPPAPEPGPVTPPVPDTKKNVLAEVEQAAKTIETDVISDVKAIETDIVTDVKTIRDAISTDFSKEEKAVEQFIMPIADIKGLRPEVLAFARLMEQKMLADDLNPGKWIDDTSAAILTRLHEELDHLDNLVNNDTPPTSAQLQQAAASVGNVSMKLTDNLGVLNK